MARLLLLWRRYEDDRGQRWRPRKHPRSGDKPRFPRRLSWAEIKRWSRGDLVRRSITIRQTLLLRANLRGPVQRVVLFGCASICMLYMGYGIWDELQYTTRATFWEMMSTFLFPAVFLLIWWLGERSFCQSLAEVSSLPPGCLACGHNLTGVPIAGDGCTVCPECGAAWDFAKIDAFGE